MENMSYEAKATSLTPALIIYLLDVSDSMNRNLGSQKRIDVVRDALDAAVMRMTYLATVGVEVKNRYQIAIYAYSDDVYDVLGGIQPLSKIADEGIPELKTFNMTDTALGFQAVEDLLKETLKNLSADSPAPLVCHLTDGLFTGKDPEPTVRRIMSMPSVPDGNVLIENIFISDDVLKSPVKDPRTWEGIIPGKSLASSYAEKLRAISSPLPAVYWKNIREAGYDLDQKAVMMLPGTSRELIELGFVMSAATRTGDL
jgi:hypothetical protein